MLLTVCAYLNFVAKSLFSLLICGSDADAIKLMDYVFPALITMLGHHKVSGYGRDNAMELILKFVTRRDGCGWSKYFINARGILTLVSVSLYLNCLNMLLDSLSQDRMICLNLVCAERKETLQWLAPMKNMNKNAKK